MASLQNTFGWSLRRERLFTECQRKYWLQYYGSWGGWEADSPPEIKVAYVLKQLRNRHMWAGSLVHTAVERVLEAWRRGHEVHVEAVEEDTVSRMRAEFRSSRARRYVHQPKTCALFEHHYDVPLEDSDWLRVRAHVSHCLRTFFRSQWATELAALSPDDWLGIERFGRFNVQGITVIAVPDAAHRIPGTNRIRIIDWKTGRTQGGDDDADQRLQLTLYTRYAVERWGVHVDDVDAVAVNLHHGDADEIRVTAEDMDRLEERIVQSAQPMLGKLIDGDVRSNRASVADFPLLENTAGCRDCMFKELCWRDSWREL
jgi:hypothetical protein